MKECESAWGCVLVFYIHVQHFNETIGSTEKQIEKKSRPIFLNLRIEKQRENYMLNIDEKELGRLFIMKAGEMMMKMDKSG